MESEYARRGSRWQFQAEALAKLARFTMAGNRTEGNELREQLITCLCMGLTPEAIVNAMVIKP